MSLDLSGFDKPVEGGDVIIQISDKHPLIRLASKLPWEELQGLIEDDLKRTEKAKWWIGRPMRVRVHLGIYLLQQLFNLTDRQAEMSLRDNAAFRCFCGFGIMKRWHVPDHTKIETFRSRLLPETQRQLANAITVHAARLRLVDPCVVDVDSTPQQANIGYPAPAKQLMDVARLAKRCGKYLNKVTKRSCYRVRFGHLNKLTQFYYSIRKKNKAGSVPLLKRLWQDVYSEILPVLKDSHKLLTNTPWYMRAQAEKLRWRGNQLLDRLHESLFVPKEEQGISQDEIYSLHARDVVPINKNKLTRKIYYGRVFQLARLKGNFAWVAKCTSLHMPDASSLKPMLDDYQSEFGEGVIESIATDRGYYSLENQEYLQDNNVDEIYLPKPSRELNAPRIEMDNALRNKLDFRRNGVEAIIGHLKHGWQMERSRMKSDNATLSAGYASVLGFNLRQLLRHATGELRPFHKNQLRNPKLLANLPSY